jgi:branched-chain amino acid transport system permease protein
MRWRYVAIALLAVIIVSTQFLPLYAVTLLTEVEIFALFAMSLDLMVGYSRLISFGHAAAFGLGAYGCALILLHTDTPFIFAILLATLFTGVIAVFIGWTCTLAKGISFAMLTLAFGQLFYAIVVKWRSVTNGSDGLVGINRNAGPFGWEGVNSSVGYYILCGALLIGCYGLCRAVTRSPFGMVMRGIRTNEAKVRSLGFNVRNYKVAMIALAYALGGLAGALYVGFARFASPDLVFWPTSGKVLIMTILGGAGTLVGPIIGAGTYMALEYGLGIITDSWALILGVLFMLIVLFLPGGLMSLFRRVRTRKQTANFRGVQTRKQTTN